MHRANKYINKIIQTGGVYCPGCKKVNKQKLQYVLRCGHYICSDCYSISRKYYPVYPRAEILCLSCGESSSVIKIFGIGSPENKSCVRDKAQIITTETGSYDVILPPITLKDCDAYDRSDFETSESEKRNELQKDYDQQRSRLLKELDKKLYPVDIYIHKSDDDMSIYKYF